MWTVRSFALPPTSSSRSVTSIGHPASVQASVQGQAPPQHGTTDASGTSMGAGSMGLVAVATCAGWTLAGAKAAGRKSRSSKARAQRVALAAQGGVEGVRILGGWSAGTPMGDSGKIHQLSSATEFSVVAEGVAQLAFIVDASRTSTFFEEFELARGTTENTYMLFDPEDGLDGDGPLLLVDVPEQRFSEAFVEKLAVHMKRIEGVVVTSIDEENTPVLETLAHEHLKGGATSSLKVYTSKPGKLILENFIKDKTVLEEMDIIGIDDDSYVALPCKNPPPEGAPHLDVVETANPKVPEGMGVFDERNGVFFSGKFFSAHVSQLRENPMWEDLADDWHHFFDCYFFTASAQEGVRRIFQIAADNSEDQLGLHSPDVKSLAPRHGPVVRDESWKLMAKYEAWLERKLSAKNDGSALVLYASAYGNTTTMARAIERGIAATGVQTRMLNCEFCTAEDIKAAYEQCGAVAIGSPTLGGQMPIQMKEALGVILNAAQQGNQQGASVRRGAFSSSRVPCGVFGSYGWSGEAVDELYIRMKDTGFEFAFDPIRCKFKPLDKVIGECEAAGTRLAQKMNDVRRVREEALDEKLSSKLEKKEGNTESSVIKAFGRIINASCILTMVPEEGKPEIRMPVSWVSQASFTPLGVMLAVEKENLDSFMQLPLEEQLTLLLQKYDTDNSGELDKEEGEALFDELFGATPGSASGEMLRTTKDEAWKLLDADGSGTCDVDEFRAAATDGPLADLISQQRKVASLEAFLSDSAGSASVEFTLSMLPEGMAVADAMQGELEPKKKPKNGCPAIKGATSYIECKLKDLMSAGRGSVLYAAVVAGEVLDQEGKTGLLKANHVAQEVPEYEAVGV